MNHQKPLAVEETRRILELEIQTVNELFSTGNCLFKDALTANVNIWVKLNLHIQNFTNAGINLPELVMGVCSDSGC